MPTETTELPHEHDILTFLKEAYTRSWPDGITLPREPGLYGFEEVYFRRDPWEYLDLNGGKTTDVGIEVIFYREKVVWGTSYRGGVISATLKPTEIFAFLKEALKAPNDSELPLRGPAEFRNANLRWLYRFRMYGEFRSFIAIEQVQFDGDIAYERTLIGGRCGDNQLYGPPLPLYMSLFDQSGRQ